MVPRALVGLVISLLSLTACSTGTVVVWVDGDEYTYVFFTRPDGSVETRQPVDSRAEGAMESGGSVTVFRQTSLPTLVSVLDVAPGDEIRIESDGWVRPPLEDPGSDISMTVRWPAHPDATSYELRYNCAVFALGATTKARVVSVATLESPIAMGTFDDCDGWVDVLVLAKDAAGTDVGFLAQGVPLEEGTTVELRSSSDESGPWLYLDQWDWGWGDTSPEVAGISFRYVFDVDNFELWEASVEGEVDGSGQWTVKVEVPDDDRWYTERRDWNDWGAERRTAYPRWVDDLVEKAPLAPNGMPWLRDVTADSARKTIRWELVGDQTPLDAVAIDLGVIDAGRPEWRLFAPGDWTEVELPALPADVERVFPDLDAGADVVMFSSSSWADYSELRQNVDRVYEGHDTVVKDNITWFSALRRHPEHHAKR